MYYLLAILCFPLTVFGWIVGFFARPLFIGFLWGYNYLLIKKLQDSEEEFE